MYANKKVNTTQNSAQQNAKIIANVNQMLAKKVVKIIANEIYLYPQLWTDKAMAINWMKCLAIYCVLKNKHQNTTPLIFKDMESGNIIGTVTRQTAKLLIEVS